MKPSVIRNENTFKLLRAVFALILMVWVAGPGCSTKIEHTIDSEELQIDSDLLMGALSLTGASPVPVTDHPSEFTSTTGPKLHSVRAPLMYLENVEFTFELFVDPATIGQIHRVYWQLDYGSMKYELSPDFDTTSGIMTIATSLGAHGLSGMNSVAYIWLSNEENENGRPVPVSFYLTPSKGMESSNKLNKEGPPTDKVIYTRTLAAHTHTVNSIAFSPQPGSHLLATGGNDHRVSLWDAGLGIELMRGEGHSQGVRSVALTPDEKYLISGGQDQTARKWNTQTGALETTWGNFRDDVSSVSVSPNAPLVALGSWDGSIHLQHLNDDQEYIVDVGDRVNSLAFSPAGGKLAAGFGKMLHEGTVALWFINVDPSTSESECEDDEGNTEICPVGMPFRCEEGKCQMHLEAMMATEGDLAGEASSIAFSNDGKQFAAGFGGGHVKLWKAVAPEGELTAVKEFQTGVNDRTVGLAYPPGGNMNLIAVSRNGYVHRWQVNDGSLLKNMKLNSGLSSVAFSADGELLAIGTSMGTVLILELGKL